MIHTPVHPLDRFSGTFRATEHIDQANAALGVLDSAFRGIGQIFLINNPLTGLALLLAITTQSVWAGTLLLGGALISTLTALLLGYDSSVVRLGFFSFNGALFGVLGAVFLQGEWVLGNAVFTLLAAAISVPIMQATIEVLVLRFDAPALSLTFGLLGLLVLLLAPATAHGNGNMSILQPVQRFAHAPDPVLRAAVDGPPVDALSGLVNATFRGIGQVVLMDSVLAGVLIVIGIALATRVGAIMAVLGSLTGALAGQAIGADGSEIYHGLWGYNGAVVAVGLFGVILVPSVRAFIATIVAAAASALLYGALTQFLAPYGIIPLSLPLVIVIIGAVLALRASRIGVIPIPDYSNAEHQLRTRALERTLS
ncbi:urea transporter [Leucobacter chromiireducens]|uniref:Urea transporter n=1 Tax=Leucobacter chromiireducens subsp. chromiireducens TaxID=660067 RepID=A0ABS1SNL7_9MICO|nr:urea transporter [Leucobacter chromiireducens]MBL3689772.1 urea transporter [Leucobacter chromiireducens subsp. chromiireducens]